MVKWFLNLFKKVKNETHVSNRIHVKDVQAGQIIQVEWHKIKGGIGLMKCISNDPETEKILLEVEWDNFKETESPQFEKLILNYSDKELANFHLLNCNRLFKPNVEKEDLETLEKKLNDAINDEDYEKAELIKKKINKLKS